MDYIDCLMHYIYNCIIPREHTMKDKPMIKFLCETSILLSDGPIELKFFR